MPQASTSHVRYQPRVKSVPFCPPPYSKILTVYEEQDPNKNLRVGQFFYNRYLKDQYGPEIDLLYNTTDFDVIFNILHKMYERYQWPME